MQVRFWTKTGYRNGNVLRTLTRGKHKGWLVVEFAHGKGTKKIDLDPKLATILGGATARNPSSPFTQGLDLTPTWGLSQQTARRPSSSSIPAAPAVYRIGDFTVTSEATVVDPVRRAKRTGYWVRRADGLTGFLHPHGDQFKFHEQLDLFAPPLDNVPQWVPMQAPQTDVQAERSRKSQQQMGLFANPATVAWCGGNKVRFTGKTQILHGGTFHEFVYLDGPKKGKIGVTQHPPKSRNPVLIATIRPGYRLFVVESGETFTILGQGPKIRGVQRYVLKDAAGNKTSMRREDLLSGQKTGALIVKDIAARDTVRNPEVLSGSIRTTPTGPVIRTFETHNGKRKALDIPVPAGIASLPDWRVDLARAPRKLSRPVPFPKLPAAATASRHMPSPFTHPGPHGEPLGRAAVADGSSIEYEWRVVPAADLRTSHDPFTLAISKDYPQVLQPRDRSRASYQDQIRRLTVHFDPAQLFWSPNVSDGSPVVGDDGVVESGNGRTMALKRVYQDEPAKSAEYKKQARAWADVFGLKWPAHVVDPVLVRVRRSEVDRAEFARVANIAGQQQMSATEQALADAGRFTDAMWAHYMINSGLGTGKNSAFVEDFVVQVSGPQSRGDMTDARGKLSQAGEDRILFCLFAKAYGLEAAPFIAGLTEARDSDMRGFLSGLVEIAPDWAFFRTEIRNGRYAEQYDLTPAIIEAAFQVKAARLAGHDIDAQRAQTDMHNRVSKEADLILIAAHPKGPRSSAASLAETLARYVDRVRAQGPEEQDGMFARTNTPAVDLLRRSVADAYELKAKERPPAQETARLHAYRINDEGTVGFWPLEWKQALTGIAMPTKQDVHEAFLSAAGPMRNPMRNPRPAAKRRNPDKYPAPPRKIPAGARVRDLGNGFVAIDGQRYRR